WPLVAKADAVFADQTCLALPTHAGDGDEAPPRANGALPLSALLYQPVQPVEVGVTAAESATKRGNHGAVVVNARRRRGRGVPGAVGSLGGDEGGGIGQLLAFGRRVGRARSARRWLRCRRTCRRRCERRRGSGQHAEQRAQPGLEIVAKVYSDDS